MTQPHIDHDEWIRDRPNLTEWDYAPVEDPQTYNDIH